MRSIRVRAGAADEERRPHGPHRGERCLKLLICGPEGDAADEECAAVDGGRRSSRGMGIDVDASGAARSRRLCAGPLKCFFFTREALCVCSQLAFSSTPMETPETIATELSIQRARMRCHRQREREQKCEAFFVWGG